MELREVRAGRKEIAVRGEADVPKGDHEALKRLRDMVLVGAAARGPVGQWQRSHMIKSLGLQ